MQEHGCFPMEEVVKFVDGGTCQASTDLAEFRVPVYHTEKGMYHDRKPRSSTCFVG